MFHILNFLQSDMVFGIINLFSKILIPFPPRKVAQLQSYGFPVNMHSTVQTVQFLRCLLIGQFKIHAH